MFNFFDGLVEAAGKLKKAVPLMVKYRIAPNPMNYAIWYNYVSNTIPEMSLELDESIKEFGTCPSPIAEDIFKRHLADNSETNAYDTANDGLASIVVDIRENSNNLCKDAKVFENILSDAMSTLDREIPTKGISPAIMDLVNKTGEFLEQNVAFQLRMDEAEARINTLQKEVKKARRDSHVDALTNLYNRRYFDKRFASLIDDDPRSPYCLVIADIDNFKHINDTYGHLLGDRVIRRVAGIISDNASGSCIPARLGGEEFGLLIANAGIIDAIKVAETMRSEVRKILIKSKRDPNINFGLTASFGVAQFKAKDSAEDLIDRADKALYQAKNKGKDRVEAL